MTAARILDHKGSEVFTVSPDDTLEAATRFLRDRRVGAAVALDAQGRPAGVFSERDLVRAVAEHGAGALSMTVSSVMTRGLITAGPGADVDELMALMTDRRVRHVIILQDGEMTGVVSIGDVVKRKIAEAEAEAENLKAYIESA
ncbi:CBS domain-containing protein [Alkalicaulis satelles]|uniref:CBS domain-containing protein n=1 Tax=Alkalicaulis satelles TaxID=2609175 RepID=A0A5M6ZEX6_9PROT|nr:CBS domain-containing protein [Alkalicaulis satelles]KAA5803312.1 CBS domain-containing protein [Alkalicaulis satelles]